MKPPSLSPPGSPAGRLSPLLLREADKEDRPLCLLWPGLQRQASQRRPCLLWEQAVCLPRYHHIPAARGHPRMGGGGVDRGEENREDSCRPLCSPGTSSGRYIEARGWGGGFSVLSLTVKCIAKPCKGNSQPMLVSSLCSVHPWLCPTHSPWAAGC